MTLNCMVTNVLPRHNITTDLYINNVSTHTHEHLIN